MNRTMLTLLAGALLAGCVAESDVRPEVDSEVASAPSAASPSTASVDPAYVPFPPGYGYMQDLSALQNAVNVGDDSVIRGHAWKLWAGIMQPDAATGWPLWYSWPNTTAAFAGGSGPVGASGKADCADDAATATITHRNMANAPNVNTPAPVYDAPLIVRENHPDAVHYDCRHGIWTIEDGAHFQSNGDILIPTESLSAELYADIRGKRWYLQSTLNALHQRGVHQMAASQRSIVTKHMYWPVKATGLSAIPVWKNNFPVTFTGYAGYEVWNTLVAVDPSGQRVGETARVSFLYGVLEHDGKTPQPTVTAYAPVFGLDAFYFHRVTPEDWASFDDADKAIIQAASLWAHNQPFEVGDYLVTVAMHVNTRELPSWTLQSVWWSDTPNQGSYAFNRPDLPQAQGPWDHYLLTDSYAVPPNPWGEYDIAVNPYIEGVIHPIATSCRNCHQRAGWPSGSQAGEASYQNPDCPDLLAYLTPESACLRDITLSDFMWIVPDRATAPGA